MLKRLFCICAGLAVSTTLAQHSGTPVQLPGGAPGRAAAATAPLREEGKLQFLIRALGLDDNQRQQANALLDIYRAAKTETLTSVGKNLDQIRELSRRLQEAEASGDKETQAEIRRQLAAFSSTTHLEDEFIQNLRAALSTDQTAQLDRLLERLVDNPTGRMRPVDVVRAAEAAGLSAEQTAKLSQAKADFRKGINAVANFNDERDAKLDEFIGAIRGMLTAPQVAAFNQQVEALKREDAAARG